MSFKRTTRAAVDVGVGLAAFSEASGKKDLYAFTVRGIDGKPVCAGVFRGEPQEGGKVELILVERTMAKLAGRLRGIAEGLRARRENPKPES